MRLPDGKNTISQRAALANVVLVLVAFACLTGCGSHAKTGTTGTAGTARLLSVADSNNNRVLIYDAPLSNDLSANVVLGQAGFTTATAALTASGMSSPAETAQDKAGNIYVSDMNNNRVLQFRPPFTNGMSASLVIGQPDFVTSTINTTQNGLFEPLGLAFDGSGNLWVVDMGNARILQYKPPFGTGMNASLVIGQMSFTSNSSNALTTTNFGLQAPQFIAFDASGNLWVTDTGNNRVLEFKPPFTDGMTASLVIGQTDFFSRKPATTSSGLTLPTGIAFDSAGNLWVGDTANNRVLQFKPAFTDSMSASLVLGQARFTTSTAATTQSGFDRPFGIAFDRNGDLEVADQLNNRTMVFTAPFSVNQNAFLVLGQANFTTATAATTATGQNHPNSVTALF